MAQVCQGCDADNRTLTRCKVGSTVVVLCPECMKDHGITEFDVIGEA